MSPEPALAILAPAFDAQESTDGLARLGRIDMPLATKFVVTRGKFDAHGASKALNIETGYPREIADLQTLATVAGHRYRDDQRFRDGYDLFCVLRLIERHAKFDLLLLLRDAEGVEQGWADMVDRASGNLFSVDGRNLLLDLSGPRSGAFIRQAWRLYRSGAVFAMQDYRLGAALETARDSLDLVASLRPENAA